MSLGGGVWGVGVDDCEFQRLILGGIFEQARQHGEGRVGQGVGVQWAVGSSQVAR